MNLYCQKCGASWPPITDSRPRWTYFDFLSGLGCQQCQWGQGAPEERPARAEMMQILRERYGDDLETIASELADMEEKELI